MTDSIEVVVASITHAAEGINIWDFRRADGGDLPPFTAGAHVDLRLSNGLVRSYSLCNSQDERHRYVVAINRDPASRGGSTFIHDTLRAGDRMKITPPRNNFPLIEDAPQTVLIAGGIGITPIWSMIQRLESLGRSWELHYSARVRQACAFRAELERLEARRCGRVHFNFDREPGGHMTDLDALIARVPSDTHLYCCGPVPMLASFEAACKRAARPQASVHVEYFTSRDVAAATGGFLVVLKRTGKNIEVPAGSTILDALLANGIDTAFSCTDGICGTCETRVLEGIPDHRDAVLSPSERTSNKTMMICCSGSKTDKLVLDL